MHSPFSNILDWHRAIARWDDLVTATQVVPSTTVADIERASAVGDITLVVHATGVTVRAALRLVYRASDSGEVRVAYAVGSDLLYAGDVEEAVALIVALARRVPPPPHGKYKRRTP